VNCAICELPIPARPYQDPATVRACSPGCAQALAAREHPEMKQWGRLTPHEEPLVLDGVPEPEHD